VVLVVSLVKTLVIAQDGEQDRLDLVAAANVCEVDLIGDLLARGADPNGRGVVSDSSEAEYPLGVAASYCGAPAIEALLAAGASPELPADHPPLAVAIESGNGDAVDVLLDAGADPNWADADGRTLIWTAADDGETAIVSALIEAGARANEPDNSSAHTPLFRAVMGDHVAVVEQLLAAGADPNGRGELTWFDIGMYVYSLDEDEQVQVVESLGQALGLDPEVLSRFEPGDFTQAATMLDIVGDASESVGTFTPLYMATVRGDAEMVEVLLSTGADPAIGTEPTGHLPRQAAESLGRDDLVALLQPE
jgi:ankyrin repeat protein